MKDAYGQEVKIGDSVHVKVGSEWLLGKVVKVQDGGLSLGAMKNGQQAMTVDGLTLEMLVQFAVQPGIPHQDVFKVVAPEEAAAKSPLMM